MRIHILLFGIVLMNSLDVAAQAKYWVSTYSIDNNVQKKNFGEANRLFLKKTADSLMGFDVSKSDFAEKFEFGYSYISNSDTSFYLAIRGSNLFVTENLIRIYK